jgi:hypothetical protein
MKKLMMSLTLLAWSVMQVNASGTSTNDVGFIMCGGKKLIIADAAASWNAKTKELHVYLSPHKFTDEDLRNVKRGGMWAPGSWKESPDKKLWGNDCPSVHISIDVSTEVPSLSKATAAYLTFFKFDSKLPVFINNKSAAEIPKVFQSLTVKDNYLTIRSKGSEEMFDNKYIWDLSISCPILNVEEQ